MVYSDIHLPLPGFIALDWALMTLALIPILLRLSLRRKHVGPHSLATNMSDSFVLLAWLSGIVLISINAWKNSLRQKYVHYEPKSDLYYMVPRPMAAHLLYVSWISLYFIYISLWCSKAAFLALYYSLFNISGSKKTRMVLYAASAFTLATFLLHMLLLTCWCHPIALNWNVDGELCSAVHSIRSVTISTFANVATDLVILAIPISALVGMRLGKVELSGLAFVFLMGSLSVVAALTRFICLELVRNVPRADITHTIDVWALVEIVSSLLAVCLPSLRTFIRSRRPGSREQSTSKSSSTSRRSLKSTNSSVERNSSADSKATQAEKQEEKHWFQSSRADEEAFVEEAERDSRDRMREMDFLGVQHLIV